MVSGSLDPNQKTPEPSAKGQGVEAGVSESLVFSGGFGVDDAGA